MAERRHAGTTHTLAGEKVEADPSVEIGRDGADTVVRLQKGGTYTLPVRTAPLESRETVRKLIGIDAELKLELGLGKECTLFLLDRGPDKQGVSESIIPGASREISDRYLLVDMAYLLSAQSHYHSKEGEPHKSGLLELHNGITTYLGADVKATSPNFQEFPDTVSGKHTYVSFGFDDVIKIVDCASANGTLIRYRELLPEAEQLPAINPEGL